MSNTQLPPQGRDPLPLDRSPDPRVAALSAIPQEPVQENLLSAINTIRRDSAGLAKERGGAVESAVAEARQQEAHQMNVAQGFNILRREPREEAKAKGDLAMTTAKLQGEGIKNETATTDLEIKKAKAAQDGLAPLMDQSQNPGFSNAPAKPNFPQDGLMAKALLASKHGNIAQGTLSAVQAKIQQNTQLQNLADGRTSERRTDVSQYIQDELARGFAAFEQEKTLRNGPLSGIPVLGTAVDLVGGLLNLASGDYQLGSEIFGGTPDAGQKLDMLTQVSSRVGPMVNAELRDLLGQQRLEQSNSQYVGRRGASGLARGVREGDMEHLDQRMVIALDARRLLQSDENTKILWNTDIINGPRMSFNEFENMEALNYDLTQTTTPEAAFQVGEQIQAAENRMHQHMQAWMADGGTMDQFKAGMIASKDVINTRYQQPLGSVNDATVHKNLTNEKVVAFELTNKMTKWAQVIENNSPANIRGALVRQVGTEEVILRDTIKSSGIEGHVRKNQGGRFMKSMVTEEADISKLVKIAKAEPAFSSEHFGGPDRDTKIKKTNLYKWLKNYTFDTRNLASVKALLMKEAGGDPLKVATVEDIVKQYGKDTSRSRN
tara:strand:+ start:14842 stop:16659 length:1818 start_codon:yes stop_codon:yes gene_type:complete